MMRIAHHHLKSLFLGIMFCVRMTSRRLTSKGTDRLRKVLMDTAVMTSRAIRNSVGRVGHG
jgi:hypothetical protein